MLNTPEKPFIYYKTSLPPLSSEPGVSQATSHITSGVGLSSLTLSPPEMILFFLGAHNVSLASYSKALDDGIRLLVRFSSKD